MNLIKKTLNLRKSKKGKLSIKMLEQWILGIVLVVVLFKIVASLIPEAQTAGDEVQTSGVPLGTFFGSGGIVFLVIMLGVFIVLILTFLPGKSK